jgi:hypothetical protein
MKRLLLAIALVGLLPILPQTASAADNYLVCCDHNKMDSPSNCQESEFYKCQVLAACNSTYDTVCKMNVAPGTTYAKPASDAPPPEGSDLIWCCPLGADCKKTNLCEKRAKCGGDFPQNCSPKAAITTTPAPPPYPKCDTSINYSPSTEFVECCGLTSKGCSDCCVVDKPHANTCPIMKSQKLECSFTSGTTPIVKSINLPNALGTPYLQVIIGNFTNILVGLAGSLALLIFVWAGISMIIADGDAKKIDTAKRMMIWTGVGLFVIFASEAIVRLVLNALMKGTVS